jgi:hypothetical protein
VYVFVSVYAVVCVLAMMFYLVVFVFLGLQLHVDMSIALRFATILILAFHVCTSTQRVCSDAGSLSLTAGDGSTTIFAVDQATKTTSVEDLSAKRCECGGVDVSKTIADLAAQVAALNNTIAALRNSAPAVKTLLKQSQADGSPQTTIVTPRCDAGQVLVGCRQKLDYCATGNGAQGYHYMPITSSQQNATCVCYCAYPYAFRAEDCQAVCAFVG